jgi:hypothetical protein
MSLEDILTRHTDRLLSIPGVVGVGEGERAGQPVVLVMVAALTPELAAELPDDLDGHPLVTEVTGEITAFDG